MHSGRRRIKHEWRKLLSCGTPRREDQVVFDSFFVCAECNSKEDRAIWDKYVDGAGMTDQYEKTYKAKHGVDLAKARAGHESDPNFVPPPDDEVLWYEAVAAHIKDKASFVEAVAMVSVKQKDPVSRIGELEQVKVKGDTATGHARVTAVPRAENRHAKTTKLTRRSSFDE